MKIKYLISTFLVSFTFYSCINTNSPEAVAEKFLVSFSKLDYETAKSVSTKPTWELLGIMEAYTKELSEEEVEAKSKNLKIKITDNKRETDSTVLISYTTMPKILPFNKLRLLRQLDKEGRERWKVDISTLDLIAGEELYMDEENNTVEDYMDHHNDNDSLNIPNQE